jgi:OOP family OmpA-OmpF porin
MAHLIDSIREYITPELLTSAAERHGEPENGISKAIGALVPTVLAGLLQKSGDSGAMNSIFNLLSRSDSAVLDNPAALLRGDRLTQDEPNGLFGELLGMLFGSRVPAMNNAVSSYAGVQSSTVSSLLGLVGPLIMGVLSKRINTGGLSLSGLVNLLKGESASIMSALPSGVGTELGSRSLGDRPTPGTALPAATGNRWLWPVLLLAALAAAIIFFLRNCR